MDFEPIKNIITEYNVVITVLLTIGVIIATAYGPISNNSKRNLKIANQYLDAVERTADSEKRAKLNHLANYYLSKQIEKEGTYHKYLSYLVEMITLEIIYGAYICFLKYCSINEIPYNLLISTGVCILGTVLLLMTCKNLYIVFRNEKENLNQLSDEEEKRIKKTKMALYILSLILGILVLIVSNF